MGMQVLKCFRPDSYLFKVSLISLDELSDHGVKLILLDRDNTLAPPHSKKIPSDTLDWIKRAQEQGFCLCIVSNNTQEALIAETAKKLGIDYCYASFKPLPFSIKKICKQYKVAPYQACFIGDQVLTDILAAKFSGVQSILVNPLTTKEAIWSSGIRVIGRFLAGIHERISR